MCNCRYHAADAQLSEQTRILEQETPLRSAYAASRKLMAVLIPGLLWALIPKCPVCLAAYVALATGLTVSVSVASHLRYALIAIFLVTVSVLAWSQMRKWLIIKSPLERKWAGPTV